MVCRTLAEPFSGRWELLIMSIWMGSTYAATKAESLKM